MNQELWDRALKEWTGYYGKPFDCKPEGNNHIDITYSFFKTLGIDHESKTFLDVGCGPKAPLRGMTKSKWHGLDILPREYKEIDNYVVGDCHQLPLEDDTLDIVFCSHTLEHTLAPILVLKELHRVLKADGDCVIGVPILPGFTGDDHNYCLPMESWKHLFERVGFTLKKEEWKRDCASFHLQK